MYSFTSNIRFSETNPDRMLTLSSLINYFQDCSTFQSEAIGRGFDYLEPKHRVWMLSSWQVLINRLPKLGEAVLIGTWANDFSALFGGRNFILKGECGEILAVANSIWILADTTTGRPVKITEEYAEGYEVEEPYPMENAPRKIPVPKDFTAETPFLINQSHLDYNNHVNNGQYIRMAESYLPSDFTVSEFRAEYRKAALLDNTIHPFVTLTEETCTVVLADEAHAPYATIQFLRR